LGLEFSFRDLRRLARVAFIAAPLQIALCLGAGYGIAITLGLSNSDALWIGGAITLSSTMVVLKTLSARNAIDSHAGRVMLGILIAQDLAVVPLMLLLPQLAGEVVDFGAIALAVLKSLVFLVVMYIAGTRVIPRIFAFIADIGSRELFFLSTLAAAFGAGILSHELGISFALGAFVAGMLMSETDFNHQALSDVATLRDLFALIFFVSVGMLFDPQFFLDHIGIITVLVASVLLCKTLIVGSTIRLFRYDTPTAIIAALGLSQIGEFAFVLLKVGVSSGTLSHTTFSLMIAVTVVTMTLTPALFWLGNRLALAVRPKPSASPLASEHQRHFEKHVIIVGGGLVGQYVARVLATLERPYVVIESDHKVVMQMRDRNVNVLFGDASQRMILEAAGLADANLVVVTSKNDSLLPTLVGEIRSIRRDVPIVVRVEDVEETKDLSLLRVDEVVQPQLEVGLEMVRQSLLALRVDENQIIPLLGQLRSERYEPKRAAGSELWLLRATRLLEFLWFEVKSHSALAGTTLETSKLRERFGVSVVAVFRDGQFIPTPTPDFVIAASDILGVLGTRSQVDSFKGHE
jgi:CPA2 family monovalent cation:H+ antiporter-2